MTRVLLILIGGGIGAVMRYWLSLLVLQYSGPTFPMGTLVVNLSGSFIIGILAGVFERTVVPPDLRAFLQTGVMGGYTTFSSFGLETTQLLRSGELSLATVNVLASNLGGLALVFAGFAVSQFVLSRILA
ncbi:MAG TPA: fluoride efflux transporter CrcB [Anaerolineae bacterium]|jgi:CrcB protein